MTQNGIIYKKQESVPPNLKSGWVIVTTHDVGLITTTKGRPMINSLRCGNFWGTNNGVEADIKSTSLLRDNDNDSYVGYRRMDVVAIYQNVKSWIADGAPGL